MYNICYWKKEENYLEIYILSIMSIVFTSFKHPKLPISIKIPVTLLQIVHICMTAIAKFDFMNYAFAKLVVAAICSDSPGHSLITDSISTEIMCADLYIYISL